MATEIGAKSGHCGCFDCFKPSEPRPKRRSERHYTPKEIQDFAKLVKADETDEKGYIAQPSVTRETRTTADLFKRIQAKKVEKKDE